MTVTYTVEVKRSARREWTISDDLYDDDHRVTFDSQEDAEQWVDEYNDSIPSFGSFFLRDAAPEDESGVDAYLVYRQPNLCDDIENRETSIMVAGHEPYSGTLFINEATQELFTFAYAVDDIAVCIAHGQTTCDPKGIITIDLDTFDEYRGHACNTSIWSLSRMCFRSEKKVKPPNCHSIIRRGLTNDAVYGKHPVNHLIDTSGIAQVVVSHHSGTLTYLPPKVSLFVRQTFRMVISAG